jgi:hypothetical protein
LYPKKDLASIIMRKPELKHIVWNMLSSLNNEDFIKEGRSYGGGLWKIEPSELLNIAVPNMTKILPLAQKAKQIYIQNTLL